MKFKSAIDFFANGLCFRCHMARSELNEFLEYHGVAEASWKREDHDLQLKIDEILQRYPKSKHPEIVEQYGIDLYQNQTNFPSIHRESLFLVIYNFYETSLNDICSAVSASIDSRLSLSDINGKGVERAKRFLSKVAEIDFSGMGREGSYLGNMNQLRNQLVHCGGTLPTDPKSKLNKFVAENANLTGEPGSHVGLRSGFIEEFVGVLKCFFENLEQEVVVFMNKANA